MESDSTLAIMVKKIEEAYKMLRVLNTIETIDLNSYSWIPVLTGFAVDPPNAIYRYKLIGKLCVAIVRQPTAGTSNSAFFTITAPFTALTLANMAWIAPASGEDNSVQLTTPMRVHITSGSGIFTISKDYTGALGFTNVNGKRANFTIMYEIE